MLYIVLAELWTNTKGEVKFAHRIACTGLYVRQKHVVNQSSTHRKTTQHIPSPWDDSLRTVIQNTPHAFRFRLVSSFFPFISQRAWLCADVQMYECLTIGFLQPCLSTCFTLYTPFQLHREYIEAWFTQRIYVYVDSKIIVNVIHTKLYITYTRTHTLTQHKIVIILSIEMIASKT